MANSLNLVKFKSRDALILLFITGIKLPALQYLIAL